ncbi:GNAT family N-acetyltransferase [Alicyclobacillus sp. ALC3]|uniref:GNAT family N-acetyltransferase n=1 Tax=Alicyclobacillus sp. ALC3 TaxID=2796143 RepID=UPI002379B084|nr:GNAT family N-acetyltransferase [Alicyclobacillus sp. ALC3]WDL96683.1 GNAT family N-acetyltransferase [Alicyclobacillus sp. ALC3]
MNFVSQPVTTTDATTISGWAYEPPYDFYNMGAGDESTSELLSGSYRTVKSTNGDVIGFYCVGESAQVPAGHEAGAYPAQPDVVDFGIGMQPELTGQGLGTEFLSDVLNEIVHDHPSADIRLTVATFNKRAIRLYQRFGFQPGTEFEHNGVTFQVMIRPAGDLLWIRRATAEDEQYLHPWLADSRDCVGAIGHEPFRREDFVEWMDADDQRLWVLESESSPVGYGEVWIDDEGGDAEPAHLVVAPDQRGRGLGAALARYRAAGFEEMTELPDWWPREYVWMRRPNNRNDTMRGRPPNGKRRLSYRTNR